MMAFTIQVDGQVYYFQGPVTPNTLPENSGVYMVMGDGGHPVYIGEAADMRARVKNHERYPCWRRHGSGESIRFTLTPNSSNRVKVEGCAIEKWKPMCNKT